MPVALAAAAGAPRCSSSRVDHWGAQLASPLIAYALLWLGAVLPSPALVQRHDISYGVYIYAFPVQQLLVYAGATRLGLVGYDVVAALVTAALAALSWRAVERPVLRRVRRRGSPAVPSRPSDDVPAEHPRGAPAAAAQHSGEQRHRVRP